VSREELKGEKMKMTLEEAKLFATRLGWLKTANWDSTKTKERLLRISEDYVKGHFDPNDFSLDDKNTLVNIHVNGLSIEEEEKT